MQLNRLHKLLGMRVCEFLYVIKRSYTLVKTQFVNKLFGKKNPFIDEQDEKKNPKVTQSREGTLTNTQLKDFDGMKDETQPKNNRLATEAFFDQKKIPGSDLQGPS